MITYNSQYQTQFEEFSNPCQLELDPGNRWIPLGGLLPWDRMVDIYQKKVSPDSGGAAATDPRWIIGAFIIKHKLGLSDEETLQTISENPYMQFFVGLPSYRPKPLFLPTLFVELRKKLGEETFGRFSQILITLSSGTKPVAGMPTTRPPTCKTQAETYRLLTGHYPELIQCDKIYHTNDNRSWCSERGIRMSALPKGAKPKLSAYEKRKQRKEYTERNHIEGRIGNAKQALSLNQIKAKLRDTSETWIAATLFVLNLSAFAAKSGLTF